MYVIRARAEEIDRSTNSHEHLENVRGTVGAARYKRRGPKIVRIGRYYTSEQVVGNNPPRSFLFNTKRAAKKFWHRGPLLVNSPRQLLAIFGSPNFEPVRIPNAQE